MISENNLAETFFHGFVVVQHQENVLTLAMVLPIS